MRSQYKNGDEISLKCGCDGCNPSMINNVLCHESLCSYSWKDYSIECFECGFDFYREDRNQILCQGCLNPEYEEDNTD